MITVEINSVDVTDQISQDSLTVTQKITYQVDTASFDVQKAGSKTLTPAYGDTVAIYDGADKIFGGTILSVSETPLTGPAGIFFKVKCVDHTYEMDKLMAARTYENTSIPDIIDDLISSYTTGFTTNNVLGTFIVEKIVFNQVPISTCIKRLADVVNYDWYIDEDKDVHFFPKYTNSAPFGLTDTNGNYIRKTLQRLSDGAEVVNRVKVRGGYYNGATYTDDITVVGNDTKSFTLPYRMANLTVELNTGAGFVAQTVGIDFIDDFSSNDVLHNFLDQSIRWETALSDGDVIRFSGNPKVGVFGVAEDPTSIATYGKIEKFIRDDSIESNLIARRRAHAELYTFAEPLIDMTFQTYVSGLRAGQLINVQSDIHGIDEDLIIKQLDFKMRDHDNFFYNVKLVSTRRYDFITLLQKIIEPDPRPGDEQETSEEIFTDTAEITVQESYDIVSAFEDTQQVETQENYELDPFGANTDAIYVLAPYTPTSQFDTMRPGRLDISLVVYAPSNDYTLLETGDFLLLESGDKIIIE